MVNDKRPQVQKSSATLRERAEALLLKQTDKSVKASTEDFLSLIHELSVHQVELELQNEELHEAQAEVSQARDRYVDLYQHAPIGYITLDQNGKILETNLAAARLLDTDYQSLLLSPFSKFLKVSSQDEFYLYQQRVMSSRKKVTAEIDLRPFDGTSKAIRLEGNSFTQNGTFVCRIALIDLSAQKQVEIKLRDLNSKLEDRVSHRTAELVTTSEELESTSRRLRNLLNNVDVIISDWEMPSQRPTFVSQRAEEILGYPLTEWFDTPDFWYEVLLHPEDREKVFNYCIQETASLRDHNFVYRARHVDGRVLWLHEFVTVNLDSSGKVVSLTCAMVNVTEEKRAEQLLESSHDRLKKVIDVETVGVVFWDLATNRVTDANKAFLNLTGYYRSDIESGAVSLDSLVPTDESSRYFSKIRALQQTGRYEPRESVYIRKDGSRVCCLLAGSLLGQDAYVEFCLDITRLKEAEAKLRNREERLRAILSTATDAIINVDLFGIITDVNTATENMFGYQEHELVGRNVKILLAAPYCEKHDIYVRRLADQNEQQVAEMNGEVIGRHKNGSTFPIQIAFSKVDGLDLFTGIIHDVSERKKLQMDVLNATEDEQRRIGRDLHDGTQQELAGLGMVAQTLLIKLERYGHTLSKSNREECVGLARKMLDGIERAQREVQSISRGLVPIRLDQQGVVIALRELASKTDDIPGITCAFKCDDEIDLQGHWIATHVYRIAQEAVANSLKHAHPKHILIALSYRNRELVLKVADDGIGIGPARHHEGMGLRTMAYRASLMCAELTIAPVEGGGTLVTCKFFDREGILS